MGAVFMGGQGIDDAQGVVTSRGDGDGRRCRSGDSEPLWSEGIGAHGPGPPRAAAGEGVEDARILGDGEEFAAAVAVEIRGEQTLRLGGQGVFPASQELWATVGGDGCHAADLALLLCLCRYLGLCLCLGMQLHLCQGGQGQEGGGAAELLRHAGPNHQRASWLWPLSRELRSSPGRQGMPSRAWPRRTARAPRAKERARAAVSPASLNSTV